MRGSLRKLRLADSPLTRNEREGRSFRPVPRKRGGEDWRRTIPVHLPPGRTTPSKRHDKLII